MTEKRMPLVLPDDNGIRPLMGPDKCCYCKQLIGEPHKQDCVILKRKVRVRYIFDLEVDVPHFWAKENIEFHRNEGSWCANNALTELESLTDEDHCLCGIFKCEVLHVPDVPPYREDKDGNVHD